MRVIHFIPAVVWFIVSAVLLTLPSNDLPHNSLFDIPGFDKVVHLGMFFLLGLLFCFPFSKIPDKKSLAGIFIKVIFCVIMYGIIMEFIQKFFTSGRSFDLKDILFDAFGSFLGLAAIRYYTFKKIGPDKNGGRNQN